MSHTKTKIVLFNYGGGMRGLIPAYLMQHIEERTNLRMTDMIDIFTGPSTGAILNAALNIPSADDPLRPKYRARHMVRFYEREGERIFPPDRFREFRGFIHDFNNRTMKLGQLNKLFRHGHYNPAYLSKCLKDLYGDFHLSDAIRSLIIPVYNIDGEQLEVIQESGETADTPVHTQNNFSDDGGHAVWFKTIKHLKNSGTSQHVRLHDAIMASCAAPTYFPCHHFSASTPSTGKTIHYSGIDGSIFDNPCISYHGALRQHLEPDTKIIMITLGTGHTLRSFKHMEWNKMGGLGVVDPANDLPLINILFHAPETALIESFSEDLGDNLFAFNKSIIRGTTKASAPSESIDDAGADNLQKMKGFAESIIEENAKKFDEICEILVRNYEQHGKPQKRGFWGALKSHLRSLT
jgi:patatin-like phospholipase/acyl hydrolase